MDTSEYKNNGVYYTPKKLADFLASNIIKKKTDKILDPSYGEGSLLLSAYDQLEALGSKNPAVQLYGIDIIPQNEIKEKLFLTNKIDPKNLKTSDFFSVKPEENGNNFDIILMNPPFIRHHNYSLQDEILTLLNQRVKVSGQSDLWAFFLIRSLDFLNKDGNIGVILPWSFIQAEYSKTIRNFLLDKFERICITLLGEQIFENTQERVIVLFGEKFGQSTRSIEVQYSFEIPEKNIFKRISKENWVNSFWGDIPCYDTGKKLQKIAKLLGFKVLKNYADLRIGIVTGANSFFVVDEKTIKCQNFPERLLRPIIRNSRDLKGLSIDHNEQIRDFLLTLPENYILEGSLKEYISSGEKKGINYKCHARKRDKWYSISDLKAPDAFLHYMTKEIPYIVSNPHKILCTNTIHRVYFKERVSENTKKMIQLSMLSSISQLSIELLARTYGGGVLKIEPSAAGLILIHSGDDCAFPEEIEREINSFLLNGERQKAMQIMDNWIIDNMQISKKDYDEIKNIYCQIKEIRQRKGQCN